MKRIVFAAACIVVLVFSLIGCSLFTSETTLTIKNDSTNEDISSINVREYIGISSKMIDPNALNTGEVVAPGEKVTMVIAPVYAQNNPLYLRIFTDSTGTDTYVNSVTKYIDFEPGADIVITYHGIDANPSETTILNGTFNELD